MEAKDITSDEIETLPKDPVFHHTEHYKGRDIHFFTPIDSDSYFIVTTFTKVNDTGSFLTRLRLSKELVNDPGVNHLEYIHNYAEAHLDRRNY
jgi:hypothetical protein